MSDETLNQGVTEEVEVVTPNVPVEGTGEPSEPEINEEVELLKLILSAKGMDITDLTDEVLLYELGKAANAINTRRQRTPKEEEPVVEPQYKEIQMELVIESISRYGAEGEISHNENGINRTYTSSDIYTSTLLNRVIPIVGV